MLEATKFSLFFNMQVLFYASLVSIPITWIVYIRGW